MLGDRKSLPWEGLFEAIAQTLPPPGSSPPPQITPTPPGMLVPFTEATSLGPNPVLKKLGFGPQDRLLIVHVDDIGLTQSNVEGFADLMDFGLVTSGSVMMPTAWAPLAAEYARTHPQADVGVHLTLTSEWEGNRWGALSTVDQSTGLLDPDGYLQSIASLKPGVHLIKISPAKDTPELRAMTPGWENWVADYSAWTDPALVRFIKSAGIDLIGWDRIQEITLSTRA